MNGWRGWGGSGEEGPDSTKVAFAIGAGLGLLVLGWMLFARGGEENVSSSGFSEGGEGVASSPFSRERRGQTGLAMISRNDAAPPSSVKLDSTPGVSPYAAAAPAAAGAAAPGPAAAAPPAAAGRTPAELSDEDKAAAARQGVPKTPRDLAQLGMDPGIFKTVFQGLAHYPRVVGYLLNNSYVVDGYMNRESSKKVFGNPDGMKQYLSDVNGPVSQSLPLFLAFLKQNPELASVVASSALVGKIEDTPGFKGFVNDPASTIIANPALVGVLTDPKIIQGIAADPAGAAALATVQKNTGLGR